MSSATFSGDTTTEGFHGQFLVKKLPRLNSMVAHVPETYNFVFRQGRRKLHIEIPHLGPETTRDPKKKDKLEANKDATKSKKTPTGSVSSLLCMPNLPSKTSVLDF